jgi:DNA-binding response OmpR family regulator
MRLLIVEDNERLASVIAGLLAEHAYVVDTVATVEEALAALESTDYDLILLDLSLPDGEGVDILRRMRRQGRGTPVLVLTARSEVGQRVQTLDLGADDYVVKPVSPAELLARVRALLRRPRQMTGTVMTTGNVSLDTIALTLSVNGAPVDIPRRELGVLMALMTNQGRLLPKQKLLDAIYSFDQEVTPNALEAAVSRLRRRLEACGAEVTITAMRGLGYILAPVEEHATEA